MEATQFKFIDLKNSEATPSHKFDGNAAGVKATKNTFLAHIDGLYSRDQSLKKPDLTSATEKVIIVKLHSNFCF